MAKLDHRALFDPHHYLAQLDASERVDDALLHYETIGCRRGLAPSPYFDVTWYRLTNKDLEDFDDNILDHYVSVGSARHVDPHPSFRAHWYRERYLSDAAGTDPLLHYASEGWQAGLRPNPLFWTDWYAKTHLGSRGGCIDPFLHFLLGGWRDCDPNPLFRTSYYRRYGDGALDPDPLSHYLHVGWRRGHTTHPLFDPEHFLRDAKLEQRDLAVSPLEILLSGEVDADPHQLFSSAHYRLRLAAAGIDAPEDQPAIITYLERGPRDTIDPHPFFSKTYYLSHSPDVRLSGLDALEHYITSGAEEGRSFHPLFSVPHYRGLLGETATINPLLHYLELGSKQGLSCRDPEAPDQTIRHLPTARRVTDLPTDGLIDGAGQGEAPRIGAFLHIFYPELAPEMLRATNNIPAPCTVFISTDSLVKLHDIRRTCEEVLNHPFEIRVLPNRGRDIAPMVVGYADRLREVDIGVHLHSKRSRHYASEFEAWRRHLIDGNMGSPELVANILALLSRDEIGAVMPEHYYPIRDLIQWGGNFRIVSGLMTLLDEEIHRDSTLDFPSGSMFWFKTKALAPLLDLNLTIDHFDHESGQVDGTLAHAIERSFFYFVEIAGFEYAVIRPKASSAKVPNPGRFIGNRFFITDRDKGPLRHHYAETTSYLARPSDVDRPRINLLIPTVDTGKAYAGVATALDLFAALRDSLGDGYDARMLSTDVSPGNQFCPPAGFELRAMADRDEPGIDGVEDAARRFNNPFFVRRKDIFVATAWWTAMNAFEIGRQQAALFGGEQHPIVYLIQDDERGFYPWSTKYALADATYRQAELTIPVFNTELLFEDFRSRGHYQRGHVLNPGINSAFASGIDRTKQKERLVLLYARPHAERNCLPFLDAVISEAVRAKPCLWDGWRFLAIGEDFDGANLACDRIEVLGRLSIDEYAELSSRAALAVSLMVSPHPSYPPLEMADAGALVLTNTYAGKDLSALHDNIQSFRDFDLPRVAAQLCDMALAWQRAPDMGWAGEPRVDWFFGGGSNLAKLADDVAQDVRAALGG